MPMATPSLVSPTLVENPPMAPTQHSPSVSELEMLHLPATQSQPAPQNLLPNPSSNHQSSQSSFAPRRSSIRRTLDGLDDGWAWEFASMMLSLASMVAVVVILICYDGMVFPYVPGDISLNTIVAILSTISKSSLIFSVSSVLGQLKWDWYEREPRGLSELETFDQASRGPLGAVKLLFRTTAIRSIASIGAVITILALAIDPFVQQVAGSAQLESYVDSGDVWTERQTRPAFPKPGETISHFQLYGPYLEYNNYINSAIWNDASVYDRRAYCPSGNCRFESFDTVEFCVDAGTITNMSALEISCSFTFIRQSFKDLLEEWLKLGSNRTKSQECKVLFPGGNLDNVGYPIELSISADGAADSPQTNVSFSIQHPSWVITSMRLQSNVDSVIKARHPLQSIASFTPYVPWISGSAPTFKDAQQLQMEWASLALCKTTRSVSTTNGSTTSIPTNTSFGSFFLNHSVSGCWSPDVDDASRPDLNLNPTTARGFCEPFLINWNWGRSVLGLLGNTYDVTTTTVLRCNLTELSHVLDDEATPEHGTIDVEPVVPWVGISIGDRVRNHTLTAVMESIAAALNNFSLTLTEEAPIRGQTRLLTTIVAVRWYWLILPLGIEVLSLILLLFAMCRRRQVAGLWKDSLLAVLYHSLDSEDGTLDGGGARTMTDITVAANRMRVRLVAKPTTDGGKIVLASARGRKI